MHVLVYAISLMICMRVVISQELARDYSLDCRSFIIVHAVLTSFQFSAKWSMYEDVLFKLRNLHVKISKSLRVTNCLRVRIRNL